MGWDYMQKDPGETAKDVLLRDYGGHPEYGEILDLAVVGLREAYMAYRLKATGEVFARVFLLDHRSKATMNFGYKALHEGVYPRIANCPERILRLLTPLSEGAEHNAARAWRAECWANVAKRQSLRGLKTGDTIHFKQPIAFRRGETRDTFRVVRQGRRVGFEDESGMRRYLIPGWHNLDFEVLRASA